MGDKLKTKDGNTEVKIFYITPTDELNQTYYVYMQRSKYWNRWKDWFTKFTKVSKFEKTFKRCNVI